MTSTGASISLVKDPGTRRLFAVSILARLPLATFSIGVLVHAQHLTGSYAAAGVVSGALAIAQGLGGPVLGRLVDRSGQTATLTASALVAAGSLVTLAIAPADSPLGLLVLLAAMLGFATPPVGACLRTLLAVVVPGGTDLRAAYAVDAAATELTWVAGPGLVLLAGTLWNSAVALAASGVVLASATLLFAASPASRCWRPVRLGPGPRGGSLRSPGIQTLVLALVGVGVLFGATEVAVAAAADAVGQHAMAGLVLGLWGAGSLAGGVAATRFGGGARSARGLALLLAGLGVGHLALAPASGDLVALSVVIVVAGSMIAPILATAYAMVDTATAAGTMTEAFTWLATASAIGTSLGAAAAGAIADTAGVPAAFIVAGLGGLLAALLTVSRRRTLAADPILPNTAVTTRSPRNPQRSTTQKGTPQWAQ